MRPLLPVLLLTACTTVVDPIALDPAADPALDGVVVPDAPVPPPLAPTFQLQLDDPMELGQSTSLTFAGAPAGNAVRIAYHFGGLGPGPCPGFLNGGCLALGSAANALPGAVSAAGGAPVTLPINVPASAPGPIVGLQAVAIPSGEVSNVIAVQIAPAGTGVTASTDLDGDGYTFAQGDCSDLNANIYPGAADTYGDGHDHNCDGADGVDDDGDTVASLASGGADCDDTRTDVFAGAPELCDGVDNNCNGNTDVYGGVSVCAGGTLTETFSAGTDATDVLLVIDNSASMAPFQADLAASAADLLQPLYDAGIHLHLGVVTTDMLNPAQTGRLQPGPGTLYVDSAQADLSTATAWMAVAGQPGVGGSYLERGLDAALMALSPSMTTGYNAGFLRSNAHLHALFLSDEDDASAASAQNFMTGLNAIAAAGGSTLVAGAHSLTVQPADTCGVAVGTVYQTVVAGLGGHDASICPTGAAFAAEVTAIGQALLPPPVTGASFFLSAVADPATIVVEVTDPAGTTAVVDPADVTYTSTPSRVTVSGTFAAGSTFDVDYATP